MTKNFKVMCASFVLLGLAGAVLADQKVGEEPSLKIEIGGSARTVTKAELAGRISPQEITLYSPVYQRPMTYQGFWLDEVLKVAHVSLGEQDVVFESSDGYGAFSRLTMSARRNGWWLTANRGAGRLFPSGTS